MPSHLNDVWEYLALVISYLLIAKFKKEDKRGNKNLNWVSTNLIENKKNLELIYALIGVGKYL